ncbi:Dihydrofolate synthase @ Folylpolyglutamate synthase [hydrothermal vent metagenome]|uniref:Dihydrofolate synthase @ Folylpolyglutamate synthase n=1 Tax=hydrothermal vent metagenome TaxID=652676 RepID=A0A1W1CXH9_9ZZZZ
MQTFDIFLENKPLYYKEINHERIHIAYARLKLYIKQPKTIHVVGTNAKGSTGRIVAYLAYKSGMCVGHYTSPHILRFNERIWIDGADVSDEVLEAAHQRLYRILGKEMSDALSYFEYTTLLAFAVFENCDLMVLEAGLGGEFDATNVCDKELSIITPIGIDHQAFLGETIEEIATTKIRSIQKKVLLAPQVYDEVVDVAKKIANNVGASLMVAQEFAFSKDKGTHEGNPYELVNIAKEKGWGDYLIDNATVALQALDILGIKYDINDLKTLELFGRFYALTDNIHIDVGHNPLAARAIEKALDKEVVLIYNSLDDKDYEAVLRMLKPKVKRVEIIKIQSQRATTLEEIEKALQSVGLEYSYFKNEIKEEENYLVFGSFYVVEAFLKQRNLTKM